MSAIVLANVAEEVARSLSYARMRGASAFVTTALTYPNGAGVVIRIDEAGGGYIVSDNGYGATIAETMNAAAVYRRRASDAAARGGVSFSCGTIYAEGVTRSGLVSVCATIANVAARAAEGTAHSVELQRIRQSKDLFQQRLLDAFGSNIEFNVGMRGVTMREWDFDAGLQRGGRFEALFDLVSPAFFSVAATNMKIADVRLAHQNLSFTVALSDYERTEPSLRQILSHVADKVIDAEDEAAQYSRIEIKREAVELRH